MRLLSILQRDDFWVRTAQIFVGLFFIGSGFFKLFNYFIIGDQSLAGHFQFWIDNGWPPDWYLPFMHWGQSNPVPLSIVVIAMQFIPGFLLLINWRVREAMSALLLVQIGIFLGVLGHLGFNEFVGISLWIVLFYVLKPKGSLDWNLKKWRIFTFLLIGLSLLQLYNRYAPGDPWISAAAWQREHLAADVMSVSVLWKQFILWISSGSWGEYLWAGSWWIQLACTLLLFTRWRLIGGAGLLLFAMGHVWTWMNAVTSQGVLWVLAWYVWTTQEELLHSRHATGSQRP